MCLDVVQDSERWQRVYFPRWLVVELRFARGNDRHLRHDEQAVKQEQEYENQNISWNIGHDCLAGMQSLPILFYLNPLALFHFSNYP